MNDNNKPSMRGQKGVCLLCRHVLESQQNTNVTKRFRSSLAKEPYVLPRLVIDLDAADSKLVRKLDDLEEDTPEPLENLKAKQRHLYEEIKKGDRTFKEKVPLKTLNTTPPDLLFYALLGDPIASQTKKTPQLRNPQLRTLFRSRMIQPEDSAEIKLQQLTLDYTADEAERLRSSGFGKVDEVAIIEQIRECRIFSKLHRMISMLSQTREGCQFLGRNGSTIIKSVSSSRRVQPMSPPVEKVPSNTVLRMFNNLQLNMESKGVQLGTHLCNGALHYAGRSYNLPAVRKRPIGELSRLSSTFSKERNPHPEVSIQANTIRERKSCGFSPAGKREAYHGTVNNEISPSRIFSARITV
jgi:hypothetical protein